MSEILVKYVNELEQIKNGIKDITSNIQYNSVGIFKEKQAETNDKINDLDQQIDNSKTPNLLESLFTAFSSFFSSIFGKSKSKKEEAIENEPAEIKNESIEQVKVEKESLLNKANVVRQQEINSNNIEINNLDEKEGAKAL